MGRYCRSTPRVLILTNIISPYRVPLFNRLAQERNLQLKVVALALTEANREWKVPLEGAAFDYEVLPGLHYFIWRWELPVHLNYGVIGTLHRYNPDVVITGYDNLAYWEAAVYCKLFRKKLILWIGTTLATARSVKGLRGFLKRAMVRMADGYITYGSQATEYAQFLGAPADRISTGLNTVDMEQYRVCRNGGELGSLAEERSRYPDMLLLYVGQLIERKGLLPLLEALGRLSDPAIGLLVAGSGPLRPKLEEFCREHGLNSVYFLGFKQQEELLRYYAIADVLVLPSTEEVWGLVVNEALAAGLYVLCSKYAGAAHDLIKEGWNGAIFDPCNVEELAVLIKETKEQLSEIRTRRQAISEHACREYGIERYAEAFIKAIEDVLSM